MNEIDKNPTKLLAILKTAETNVQKASPTPMLMVNKGKAKGKGKWKGKRNMGSKSNANMKPDPIKALKPKYGIPKVVIFTIARNQVIGRGTVMLI